MGMLLQFMDADGKIVVVSAEVWIAAIIESMPQRQKENCINRAKALDEMIQKQVEDKGRVYTTPLELSNFMNGRNN